MCLSDVSLNMFYDEKEKDFVGIGYKVLPIIDLKRRVNWSLSSRLKPNIWLEASGYWENAPSSNKKVRENELKSNIYAINEKIYWPGYHIFLNIEDAISYNDYCSLIEVKFKNVTGFGNQGTNHKNGANCVIARYAKVTKILSKRAHCYTVEDDGSYPKPYVIYEE